MDILIIAGFLGSGKTTLLLRIAESLSEDGRGKIAIIENEVGDVGVDNGFLAEQGLNVRELASGCICCTLRKNLIDTLGLLEKQEDPDIVIMEPSGIAGPRQIVSTVNEYKGNISGMRIISMVDAVRFSNTRLLTMPLISDGIMVSDAVAINKIDQSSRGDVEAIEQAIKQIRPDAMVVGISSLDGSNVDLLCDYVLDFAGPCRASLVAGQTQAVDGADHCEPIVHSYDGDFVFEMPVEGDMIHQGLCDLVGNLALQARDAGCSMIGHLKGLLRTEHGQHLMVSTTTFEQKPHVKGKLAKAVTKAKLTVNAIAFDIEKNVLADLLDKELKKFGLLVASRDSEELE